MNQTQGIWFDSYRVLPPDHDNSFTNFDTINY